MSRLTRKNETIDKPYLEMCDLEMSFRHPSMYSTNCYTGKAVEKLSALEDVLEEFGIESAEELKTHLLFKENMAIWENKFALQNEIKELKLQLSKAIVPKFETDDYFEIFWNGECLLYQYEGDKKFKCLNKTQGYLCDYIILGMLLTDNPSIDKITQAEAQAKLDEIKSGVK